MVSTMVSDDTQGGGELFDSGILVDFDPEDLGTVRVSFDLETPREEVAAVLRHLATALQTNICPSMQRAPSLVDTLTAGVSEGEARHG